MFEIEGKIVFAINLIIYKFCNNNSTSDIDKSGALLLSELNITITILVVLVFFFYPYNNVEIMIF